MKILTFKKLSLFLFVCALAIGFFFLTPEKASAAAYSGSCGATESDQVNWSLDTETGVFSLTGSGQMEGYYMMYTWSAPWADYASSIRSVVVGSGITSLGDYSFYGCTNLTSVVLRSGLKTIGWCAFSGCTGLTSITIPGSVTQIAGSAFYGCEQLSSFTVPDSVTEIGESAFFGCTGLKSAKIGSGVKDIGYMAFTGCQLTLSVSEKNPNYHVSGNCLIETNTKTLLQGFSDSTIPADGSVVKIADMAFYGCKALSSLTLPESVSSIGFSCIDNCPNLTSVTIPANVVEIGSSNFSGCSALKQITYNGTKEIWDSLDVAGEVAEMDGVTVSFRNQTPAKFSGVCGSGVVWELNTSTGELRVSGSGAIVIDSFKVLAGPWYGLREKIKTVTVESGVTGISEYAFEGCEKLTDIVFPATLTRIGYSVYNNCTALKTITYEGTEEVWNDLNELNELVGVTVVCKGNLPAEFSGVCGENMTWKLLPSAGSLVISGSGEMLLDPSYKMGEAPWHAFRSLITSVSIENGVANIDMYAFEGCSKLTSVIIPASVKEIGYSAFKDCTALGSLIVPNSVESVGGSAFSGDTELKTVNYTGTDVEFRAIAIEEDNVPFTNAKIVFNYAVPGDLNGDFETTDADAIYLLMHTFFPDMYPLENESASDYNGDGEVTDADAIYLLMYTFFPEMYPLPEQSAIVKEPNETDTIDHSSP